MDNEILFESLDYGMYALVYDHSYEFSENVRYATAEFNKLHVRKVRLPDGKNNIVYLFTDSFESGINMLNSDNFLVPPGYRKVFYPIHSVGMFLGKRYKLFLMKERSKRNHYILDNCKYKPYPTRNITNSKENLFFLTGDVYSATKQIVESRPIKRCYTEYFSEFMKVIDSLSPPKSDSGKGAAWDNRILIIDTDTFGFKNGAPLKDNKANPLYLLYLAYFRNKSLESLHVDVDMMICSKNLFMKFNPAKTTQKEWSQFKRALFRIINANLDDYTEQLTEEEKSELQETSKDISVSGLVSSAVSPYTAGLSGSTKVAVEEAVEKKVRKTIIKKAEIKKEVREAQEEIADKLGVPIPNEELSPVARAKQRMMNDKELRLFRSVADDKYTSLATKTGQFVDDDEDFDTPDEELDDKEVEEDATEILVNDKEVAEEILDDINENNIPVRNTKNAPINSKRDEKLREAQKKVVVNNETIEQILERDSTNVPIQSTDKSKVMHTANKNMQQITFANFDKTYLDELYVKDIVSCFDMLKDKESPFYITNIEVHDTSTTLDYKETWTVKLKDETGKSYTVKVDIPKFQNDRFMLINGTRFIILKQNFYNPLVKDTPDTVILTTNYNKITIQRKATKSTNTIERIFSLIKKTGDDKMFVSGDSSKSNMKYISTLEYDELSRRLFKFENDGCMIYFSRDYIYQNMTPPADLKGDEFYIGSENGSPIIINEDTGMDRQGRTIAMIIEQHLPDNYLTIYNSIKGPTQSMFVEGKLAGVFIPVISTLIVWNGLRKTLDRMNIRWQFIKAKRIPQNTGMKYIKFSDGILEYENGMFPELMLNGLAKMHPERFKFEDMDTEEGYEDFIYSQWGSYNGLNELANFKEFLVDPITKQVCKDMSLPDDPVGLLIHAVRLLCDNAFVSKASDKSYRVRSIEMIPSILYGCLAAQYKVHIKSGRRIPFTLNQRCVISKLLAEKTVEPYSVLNPVVEVTKMNTISTKGYKGSNSVHSYDEEKRSYDPSAVGKLAISTSPELQRLDRAI